MAPQLELYSDYRLLGCYAIQNTYFGIMIQVSLTAASLAHWSSAAGSSAGLLHYIGYVWQAESCVYNVPAKIWMKYLNEFANNWLVVLVEMVS